MRGKLLLVGFCAGALLNHEVESLKNQFELVTVIPLFKLPGGLFISSSFEGDGALCREESLT